MRKLRLAIIVSHPIQYYVPLYRWLTQTGGLAVKVFFTWHGGKAAQLDRGFGQRLAWDLPMREGYAAEVISNRSPFPGTHHFWGLVNPGLVRAVLSWKPDAVHLTGYAFASHLAAMYAFHRRRLPLFFRGDSHLLDGTMGWRWKLKHALLSRFYRWPAAFLYVGRANRTYYERFGVPPAKLFRCSHSIEVARFAEPHDALEARAREWREELGIAPDTTVLLFAGKFEDRKRPLLLMEWMVRHTPSRLLLVLVGDGPQGASVRRLSSQRPDLFKVLPFQNQTLMPAVYRLGDIFVLPSAYRETWGLAVNEALASGRPVLVSSAVGCASDVIRPSMNGDIFRADDWMHFGERLAALRQGDFNPLDLQADARLFDTPTTGRQVLEAVRQFYPDA